MKIYLYLVEHGSLQEGSQLLRAVKWQIDGFMVLNNWPEIAKLVLQFLMFHEALETQWATNEGDREPPWRSITLQFIQMVQTLNLKQRTKLLDALGVNADRVKKLLGWQ
jgi:hypothetical protein